QSDPIGSERSGGVILKLNNIWTRPENFTAQLLRKTSARILLGKAQFRALTRRALSLSQTVQSPAKKSENTGSAAVRGGRNAKTSLFTKIDLTGV
ncbi:MAG: hypothetical protein ABGZ23_18675, partial [Fuerstiella sp.]